MRTTILNALAFMAITGPGGLQAMDTGNFETTVSRNAFNAIMPMGRLQAAEDTKERFVTTIRNVSQEPVTVGICVWNSQHKVFSKRVDLQPANVTQEMNSRRIGFVTVRVADVTKYSDITNLASEITILGKEGVAIDLKSQSDEVPAELLSTVTYKKVDLVAKTDDLIQMWNSMTAQQREDSEANIPSCLRAFDLSPVFASPYSKCFTYGMKQYALRKWEEAYGSVSINEEEIKAAQEKLLKAGIPIVNHY